MPKNILQDVLPPERKTIRNIPLPDNRSRDIELPSPEVPNKYAESVKEKEIREPLETTETKNPKNTPRLILWGIAILSLVVVVLATLSIFFVRADIDIRPKQQKISLNATFSAVKDNVPDALVYQLITVSRTLGKQVPATGSEHVDKKSSGIIVVYNNYSTASQKIIKNTRFQSPDNLIYRIPNDITVPGRTVKNNNTVPGSIEVTVFADMPGEKYNIDLVDFTIPGFKGDPRFKEIYARSKTKMTGGFSGDVKKVSPADETQASQAIEKDLKDKIIVDVAKQIPEGFILYDGGAFFTFETLPQTNTGDNTVTLNEKVTLQGFMFNKKALAREIAKKAIPTSGTNEIELTDLPKLSFDIPGRDSIIPDAVSSVTFTLKGETLAIWGYDEKKLKNDLAGQLRKNLNQILTNYPQIENARASVTPFWKRSFPENPDKINIKRVLISNH